MDIYRVETDYRRRLADLREREQDPDLTADQRADLRDEILAVLCHVSHLSRG